MFHAVEFVVKRAPCSNRLHCDSVGHTIGAALSTSVEGDSAVSRARVNRRKNVARRDQRNVG